MTPTPEQVAQWAREADKHSAHIARGMVEFYKLRDTHLVTRAFTEGRAEQAEADAGAVRFADNGTEAAEIIRANAPKVTT